MLPLRGLFMLALLGAVLLVGSGATARAHAILRETEPVDSSRLDAAPPEVRLRFNEPVTPIRVDVLDATGRPVARPGTVAVQGDTIRQPLPPDLPAGAYMVVYRATSADGHPVAGTILFGIGVTPPPEAETSAGAPASTALAGVAVRTLHLAALLAGVGGGLFLVLVPGRWSPLSERLKPTLCGFLLISAVCAVLLVGVNGAVLAGGPLSALALPSTWATGVAGTTGLSAGVALLALLVSAIGLALAASHAAGPGLLVAGAVLGAVSLAVTGHAATAPPGWLSAPLVGLHGLMAAYWLGALWPLAVVLRTEPSGEAVRLVRRFSRLAIGAVGLLVTAGAGLSILQIGAPDALLTTGYGWNWLGKMFAVAALLGLAALNRFRLTPAFGRGAAGALRRSIRVEMGLAAVVLLLTSIFTLTPPPRTILLHDAIADDAMTGDEAGGEAGYAAVVVGNGRTVLVEVTPAKPGPNRVRLQVSQPDGRPLPLSEAALEWAGPAGDAAPARRALAVTGPGMAEAEGIDMPVAGRWSLRLDVGLGALGSAMFRTEIPLGDGRDGGVP